MIDLYEAGGVAAIRPAPRGRELGDGRSLSAEQEASIRQIICDKRPEQLKMDFALWNRAAVMQLIEREFAIKLSVRGVGKYLARWGFTPQKPIRRAYEQRPEAVQAWLDEQYPEIEKRAKAEGGEIHWGDETALVNTDVRGRSYAPAGKTPVTFVVGGTRQKLSMIATVTNKGQTRWMIIDEAFNSDKLIEFLEALIKDAGRKVFLILDNLRVHHSKPVKAWAAERQDKIEVFYLPSYSPELNPEERLNGDLKQAIGAKVPGTHQGQTEISCHRTHDETRTRPGSSHVLFPGSIRQICRRITIQTSQCRINDGFATAHTENSANRFCPTPVAPFSRYRAQAQSGSNRLLVDDQ